MSPPIHSLIWADRAAIGAALALALAGALLCTLILLGAGTIAYGRLDEMLARTAMAVELCTVVPLWLLLRGIDLAAQGPWQRHAASTRALMAVG